LTELPKVEEFRKALATTVAMLGAKDPNDPAKKKKGTLIPVPKGNGLNDYYLIKFDEQEQINKYYKFNCGNGRWDEIPNPFSLESVEFKLGVLGTFAIESEAMTIFLNSLDKQIVVHSALDAVGFIPLIGSLADLTNGYIYYLEGDNFTAVLCSVAAIPLIGDVSAGVKRGVGLFHEATGLSKKSPLAVQILRPCGQCALTIHLSKIDEAARTYGLESAELTKLMDEGMQNGGALADAFQKDLRLIESWMFFDRAGPAVAHLKNDLEKLKALADDLQFHPNLAAELSGNAGLVKAWEILQYTGLRTNLLWLERIADWKALGIKFEVTADLIKCKNVSDDRTFAHILNNEITYLYDGFGGGIKPRTSVTTTILGRTIDETGNGTYRFIGAKGDSRLPPPGDYERLPEGVIYMQGKPNLGGISSLDVDTEIWDNMLQDFINAGYTPDHARLLRAEKFWDESNYIRLKAAFERGDDVRLLSDPIATPGDSFYKRELDAMNTNHMIGGTFHIEIIGGKPTAVRDGGTLQTSLKEQFGYTFDMNTQTYKRL
jgi:hypothetical protein